MNIYLIFPPVSDPRGPHLAPAAPAAALRKDGHRVFIKDVDLEMALCLLSPDILNEHLQKARELYQLADMPSKHSGWEEYSLLTICEHEKKG